MDPRALGPDPNRALAADSYRDNADLFTDVLRFWGFDAEACVSGPMALQTALERPPALLVTDVELDGFSGIELTRRLRADPRTRGCVIAVVTADLRSESVRDAWEAGCNIVLPKPCVPEDLRHALIATCRSVRLEARRLVALARALTPQTAALVEASRQLHQRLRAVPPIDSSLHLPRRTMRVLRPQPRVRRFGA
jgi:CheY-like chemotaxis protein